jgi:hypothetical protein
MTIELIRMVAALVGVVAPGLAVPAHARPPVPTPIGSTANYRLPAAGGDVLRGAPLGRLVCRPTGAEVRVAHVELFAAGRVLLIPPGVGIASPTLSGAVATGGRCRYPIWTDDPTGIVHLTSATPATLASLFAVWGQPLGTHRMCGFRSRRPVVAYVDGRRWRRGVRQVPLRSHAEIVVEIGRRIPPHTTYLFPGGRG